MAEVSKSQSTSNIISSSLNQSENNKTVSKSGSDSQNQSIKLLDKQLLVGGFEVILGPLVWNEFYKGTVRTTPEKEVLVWQIPRNRIATNCSCCVSIFQSQALSYTSHPCICSIHGYGTTNDFFVVVLDNGQTVLSEVLKQKPIDIVQFFQILTDVALAIHHLHNSSFCTCNVFDLNISSENILVPVDGDRYKLIRLNTICLESHPHSLITAPLLAPEFSKKDKIIRGKIDIFNFGILIWEMLTRRTARSVTKFDKELFLDEIDQTLRLSSSVVMSDEAIGRLKSFVSNCWASDPTRRPTARTLLTEIVSLTQKFTVRIPWHITSVVQANLVTHLKDKLSRHSDIISTFYPLPLPLTSDCYWDYFHDWCGLSEVKLVHWAIRYATQHELLELFLRHYGSSIEKEERLDLIAARHGNIEALKTLQRYHYPFRVYKRDFPKEIMILSDTQDNKSGTSRTSSFFGVLKLELPVISSLHVAFVHGHATVVKYLWTVDKNLLSPEDVPELCRLIARSGHSETLSLLLNVNEQSSSQLVAQIFMEAIRGGHKTLALKCFRYVDLQLLPSVLCETICSGMFEVVKLIVERNPKLINTEIFLGFTPLQHAVRCRNFQLVEYLVQNGADVNVDLGQGNALQMAKGDVAFFLEQHLRSLSERVLSKLNEQPKVNPFSKGLRPRNSSSNDKIETNDISKTEPEQHNSKQSKTLNIEGLDLSSHYAISDDVSIKLDSSIYSFFDLKSSHLKQAFDKSVPPEKHVESPKIQKPNDSAIETIQTQQHDTVVPQNKSSALTDFQKDLNPSSIHSNSSTSSSSSSEFVHIGTTRTQSTNSKTSAAALVLRLDYKDKSYKRITTARTFQQLKEFIRMTIPDLATLSPEIEWSAQIFDRECNAMIVLDEHYFDNFIAPYLGNLPFQHIVITTTQNSIEK